MLPGCECSQKGYAIESVTKGDAIASALQKVQYDGDDLLEIVRRRTEQALQEGRITLVQARNLLKNYEISLANYTYLNLENVRGSYNCQ